MTVKLARLENIPQELFRVSAAPKRRREPRFAAWFEARIENSHGDSADVQLTEVSLHGCRIRSEAEWLRMGAFVGISIDDGARLQAIVRWVRDGSAGMEFLRPIPSERTEWHDLMDAPY